MTPYLILIGGLIVSGAIAILIGKCIGIGGDAMRCEWESEE